MSGPRSRVILVTGMSGAGKSSGLNILEDLGYEAVDNLPLYLLDNLLQHKPGVPLGRHGAIAVTVDIRSRDFTVEDFLVQLKPLATRPDLKVELLFFDCDEDVLGRRYTETRRRHPLAEDRPLLDGIRLEREIIAPLRDYADHTIDTSALSTPDLRVLLTNLFALDAGPDLTVSVTSFSYRRGLPREADLVFDVRFLTNPYYDEALRPLTGREAAVGAHIAADPVFDPFFATVSELLRALLPHYRREGKTYLTIAIGCTGGRHRSVYVAERLARVFQDDGQRVVLRHRDVDLGIPSV